MRSTHATQHSWPAPPRAVLAALATIAFTSTFTSMFTPAPARAGDMAAIGSLSRSELSTPDESGALSTYATGGSASVMIIEPDEEVSLGFEAQATALSGEGTRRLYHFGISSVISYELDDSLVVPFIRLGLGLSALSATELDDTKRRSVTGAVHGGLGLHGFLNEKLYWRAELGFLGAGPGGVTGQLGLGYNFGAR